MTDFDSNAYTIALVGCGKMGGAMAQAWLAAGLIEFLHILDPNDLPPDLSAHASVTHHKDITAFATHSNNCDLLILAVKPQTMSDLAASLTSHLSPDICLLSIAAGQTIAGLQTHFGKTHPIIRAMPNTPAAIQKGMTVACAAPNVSASQKDIATNLLSACGRVEWIDDESNMDAVTAVSGSGPAYLFYLIETLAEAGMKAGLPKDFATTIARQTIIGSAALAEAESATPAATLRQNVTSPSGTTEAALKILMDGRLQNLMNDAVLAATERGRALSKS